MRTYVCLLLLISLTLGACREKNPDLETKPKIVQNKENIDEFMRQGPAFDLGTNLREINANLGAPLRQSVTERQNIHNQSQTDMIYGLFYEGLYIEIYHVTGMDKDLPLQLEVTGENRPLAFGLAIGNNKEKVLQLFGSPNEEQSSRWRYFASDLVMGSFDFNFQKDRLVSVKWHFAID